MAPQSPRSMAELADLARNAGGSHYEVHPVHIRQDLLPYILFQHHSRVLQYNHLHEQSHGIDIHDLEHLTMNYRYFGNVY